jgi:hypothetical protein
MTANRDLDGVLAFLVRQNVQESPRVSGDGGCVSSVPPRSTAGDDGDGDADMALHGLRTNRKSENRPAKWMQT